MQHLFGVAFGAFLESFFLGGTFLETSFKGDCPLFLMGFKAQSSTLLGPKYNSQNPILLGPKYKAKNNIYNTLYNFYK